jgi:uncharacterized protein YrrD
MEVKGSDVIGKKILTLDGKKIEDIDDILYVPQKQHITAVLVKSKGMFSDAKVILLSDIKSFGKDAVIVADKNSIKKASDIQPPVSTIAENNIYLTQGKIITEQGVELGKVKDIIFDSQSGQVVAFEVKDKKRITPGDIISIGKDATIVKSTVQQTLQQQEKPEDPEKKNSITQKISSLKKKVPQLAEKAKSKVKNSKQPPKSTQEASPKPSLEDKSAKPQKQTIGKVLQKTILLPNDEVLGEKGETVTDELLWEAERNGMTSQIIQHAR